MISNKQALLRLSANSVTVDDANTVTVSDTNTVTTNDAIVTSESRQFASKSKLPPLTFD